MDRRNSAYGKLNLSTTNITSPIAESTHLNGSSTNSKFSWGCQLFSPPKSRRPSSPPVITKTIMSPINKIDQTVYTDVQSRGLASRIVKYHENGSKLNKSLSMGSTYRKPGQLPIVHLKKKEIVLRPGKHQNISMVRIPPPDKSVFQAHTRASIFRTGSIVPTVGLPRNDDEVSRENRPILHPVGSELAPTKSVLDALREISRKRINSDELDTNDSIKKYCKESDDTERGVNLLPTHNATISKRQREGASSPNSNASVSPEQVSKRVMFSKNNDVLSSLSSSMRMTTTPKRKFDDIRVPKCSSNVTSPDASTSPEHKQQCNETNFVSFQNIDTVLASQITPLPLTPAVVLPNLKDAPKSSPEVDKEKQKPKLTLFNKNYDEVPKNIRTAFDSDLDDFASEGVIFVKPKSYENFSETNPIIERTKKSKLALMLSGLRGELNGDDDIDSRPPAKIKELSISGSQEVKTTVTSPIISFETKTTTTIIPTVSSATIESKIENSAVTSILAPVTKENRDVSGGAVPSTQFSQSSIPLNFSNSVKTTASGFNFPSQVSNLQQKTPTSSKLNPGSSSIIVASSPAVKPTFGVSDLKTVTTSTPMQSQFSLDTKSVVSTAGSFSIANTQNATNVTFGSPNPIAPAFNTQFKISPSSTFAQNSTDNGMKQVFGVSPNNESAFSAVAPGTEGPKTSQALTFNVTQSVAATTNASSLFSAPSTSLPSTTNQFGVANLRTVKTDSQNVENKSSHGFSFGGLNPAGDPKPNTTPFTFSSNSGQKPAGTGSGGFSATNFGMPSTSTQITTAPTFGLPSNSTQTTTAPTFGIPSTFTQTTTAPSFGVLPTTNPSSGSGSAPIQFSFAASNGKPSTGFTLAGTAGDNKQQGSTTSATPFSFGTPSKPKPAQTSNPTDKNNSKSFSFGVPNPKQKPIATGSIFGGVGDGKNFNFAVGDKKGPASTNSNIFETGSSSFATSASTTGLNFSFTPQSTANSIFGSSTATTSNPVKMPQVTGSSVFGGPPASTAPTFGDTTAPGPSSSIFGQASNTSSAFGAPKTTANSGFAPSTSESKPSAAPLKFGVSSSNAPANMKTFSFATNNSTNNAGGFSFSAAMADIPNKGGTSAAPAPTATPSNSFSFRQGQSTNNNSVFGTPATNSTNAPSVFGSPTKTFSFSAGSSNAPPAPSNPFGSVLAENKTDNTFSFGAIPQQQPATTSSNSKAFAFGGGPGPSARSGGFTFNTASTAAQSPPPSAPAANKTFNFGGSSTQSTNKSTAAQFSFTSATNGPPGTATPPANIFNSRQANTPSTSTNTTRDRVIRVATRRLNK